VTYSLLFYCSKRHLHDSAKQIPNQWLFTKERKCLECKGRDLHFLLCRFSLPFLAQKMYVIGQDVNMDACCNSAELHKTEITLGPIFGDFYFVSNYMMSSKGRICIEVSLQGGRRQIELKFVTITRDSISSNAPRPPLGSTKPHIQRVLGCSSSGDKTDGA